MKRIRIKLKELKDNKYLCMIAFWELLIFLFLIIICNSIITEGHQVFYYSQGEEIDILNQVGYEIDNGSYIVKDNNNHYITFSLSKESNEFLMVFDDYPSKDNSVTVWSMDAGGSVLSEDEVTWKKNERWIFLNEMPEATSLVSLSIDENNFKIYKIINSIYLDSGNKIKYMAMLISLLIVILFGVLIYKNKILTDVMIGCYDYIFADRETWKQRILCIIAFIIMASCATIIAFCFLYYVSSNGILVLSRSFVLNWKTIFLFTVGIFSVELFVVLVCRKIFDDSALKYALIVLFLVGTAYSILEPVANGISWDDEIHFKNASSFSHFIDKKKSISEKEIHDYYPSVALEKNLYAYSREKKYIELNNYYDKEGFYYDITDEKVNIKSISYLPMSLGLCIARGLRLPYNIKIIMGRWFNFLFMFILCCIAMKVLEYGNVIIALFALIPTNIFMASSYSYDTWLVALVFLGYALIFNERQNIEKNTSKWVLFWIPILLMLANVAKPVYFVMIIPAFFIQAEKFSSVKQKILYRVWVIICTILPFVLILINNIIGAGDGDARGGSEVNSAKQIEFIKNNLFSYIKILFEFLKGYLNPLTHGESSFNLLAYNGLMKYGMITFSILLIGALLNHQTEKKSFPAWYRICVILLYIAVGALCATAMYVSFTAVASEFISGCQYRYLLPVFFPVIYVLSRYNLPKKIVNESVTAIINKILFLLLVLINLYCIWEGCVKFY